MQRSASPPPSALEVVSLQRTPSVAHARPLSPRSALAATYATYVVRVHTRHGIKTISFDTLAAFFTFTAKKAAEDLGISSRTLIRVCRSLGIRRWPYLGFRSEKNVERIRQEAIENLRRKLEREGSEGGVSSVNVAAASHPSPSCLRGASAKRLLQVRLPQAPAAAPRDHLAAYDLPPFAQNPQCINTIVSPSASTHAVSGPMLTPPPTQHAFNLERGPSLSPRRMHVHAVTPFQKQSLLQCHSRQVSSPSAMPSLSVLLEASILTAFKHEVETHLTPSSQGETDALRSRTMSMRDILSNTAMTA